MARTVDFAEPHPQTPHTTTPLPRGIAPADSAPWRQTAQVEVLLARYVSSINARVVVERARRVLRDPAVVRVDEADVFESALRNSVRMFLPEARLAEFVHALALLGNAPPRPRDLRMETEDDLRAARLLTREMCQAMGAPSFVMQRVATSVSELGRNIISYTPGGTMRLEPVPGVTPRIRVTAEDRGSGIPNLDHVLSGHYQSKTGLGRGLLGVKQLMASFDIKTGPTGTRITVEALLQ